LLRKIADTLSALGHQAELIATTAPGSATIQAQQAVQNNADLVFACGGDGTVHEVMQALVPESGEPAATLGIIPMGSANALARHLRLSLDPMRAALQQVQSTPRAIPVAKLVHGGQVRYFAVMAGAGPDGALVYEMVNKQKSSLGRMAYYTQAARLFATRRFSPFDVEYVEAESGAVISRRAVSAMAVRVASLGGLFNKLVAGPVSIEDSQLRLLILRPPAWLSLPLWFVCGWLRLHGVNRFLRSVNVISFSCRPLMGAAVRFQADGESLGSIPFEVSLVSNALNMLIPGEDPGMKSR
jgi:diacylglycerol kinase family enzyme